MNGETVAKLLSGESERLTVRPGRYRLRARVDWALSVPIELDIVGGESAEIVFGAQRDALWRFYVTPQKALTAVRTN
jgi:hypothetical protein